MDNPNFVVGYARIFDVGECAGKVVERAGRKGDGVWFLFKDHAYFYCEPEHDYDNGVCMNYCPDMTPGLALAMGLIDGDGYERAMAAERAVAEADRRKYYEQLKAIYEPPTTP